MQTLWQDLRFGARLLAKQPGFTAIAVLTLALGIGANTTIFSVIHAVVLKPLPFPNQERLVAIGATNATSANALDALSYPDVLDYRTQQTGFEQFAAYALRGITLTSPAGAVRVRGAVVTADLFPALGVNPMLGRTFLPTEDKAAGGRVAILSQRIWQSRFNTDPTIIGKTVPLNGESYQIVGVMPAGFQFPLQAEPVELWANYARDCEDNGANSSCTQRGNQYLKAIGLLKPGVSRAAVEAEMNVLAAQLQKQYPNEHQASALRVIPLLSAFVAETSASLWVIFAAVSCVLLITCANVASLLLARTATRRREMAVRLALGASRWRVIRQVLVESLLLAALGGLVGCLLANWLLAALQAVSPADMPRLAEATLDGRVLLFALGSVGVTGLLVGLMPAWQATQADLYQTLKDGGRNATGGRAWARNALVIAEVAVSVVLLIGAGLLVQSFARLTRVAPGFAPQHVVTLRVALPDGIYQNAGQIAEVYQRLMTALATVPGVTDYSAVTPMPLSNSDVSVGFNIAGRPHSSGLEHPYNTQLALVGTDYFRALGIPLKQGREYSARDTRAAAPVVIVNEAFVKQFFPNENPLGQRIDPSIQAEDGPLPQREIIGVVADVHSRNPAIAPTPEIYLHLPQMPAFNTFSLVVRTSVEPASLVRQIRATVAQVDRNIPVGAPKLLTELVEDSLAAPRFNSLLLSVFAGLALSLTALGLYGVVAFSVTQRTQELGIRLALGAQPANILRLVIGQGLKLVWFGVALGLAGAFVVTRWLQHLLFEVEATDVATFGAVTLLLSLVAVLACWLPARRATKVDPLTALRCE